MQSKRINKSGTKTRFLERATLACSLVLFAVFPGPAFSQDILVGSSQTDTFNYHAARILCRLINSNSTDVNCSVFAAEEGLHSSDQLHTLTNVNNGALELGIVDSSVQNDVVNHTGRFEFFDINLDSLRSLFSLNGIPFTVIAQGGETLNTIADLKDRRVNVGSPGSPQRTIMERLMRVNGWQRQDFKLMEELPEAQSQDSLALCFGSVDAVIRFNVHPNPDTMHMVDLCGARLMSAAGPSVEKLIVDSPFYSILSVAPGIYASNQEAVQTFGLLDTVITTEDLELDTAYSLVKLVFEQLDRLRKTHPAFSDLTPTRMHSAGLSFPLHPGALKYYREQGWMP